MKRLTIPDARALALRIMLKAEADRAAYWEREFAYALHCAAEAERTP